MNKNDTNPFEPQADSSEQSNPATKPAKGWARRPVFVLLAAAILIVLLQWFLAPRFDHQYTNFACYAIGILASGYAIVRLQLHYRRQGNRWAFPGIVITAIVGFFVLFQHDGFTGEMFPIFKFRFGKANHALRDVDSASKGDAATPGGSSGSTKRTDSSHALTAFTQFLGPDRNAIITHREFDIPTDSKDMTVLWDQGIGQGWSSFAVQDDLAITLEQRDDQECVSCYRLGDGELLWIQSVDAIHYNALGGTGPRTTPTIHGDKVIAAGATGHVWSLDLRSGSLAWRVDLNQHAGWKQEDFESIAPWGRSCSPLVVGDTCVLGYGTRRDANAPSNGKRSLIALDIQSGEVKWTAGSDQVSYASPGLLTINGKEQIVSTNESTVTGHDPLSGDVLWSFDWPGSSTSNASCSMPVPAGKNRFLVGKGYGGGSSLVEVKTTSSGFEIDEVWHSSRVFRTKFTHACIQGDIGYSLSDGSLQAATISQGNRLWVQPRRSRFAQGQILLVEDTIVGQAESGDVVFATANQEKYDERFRFSPLSSKTWNVPTIAGRHLLIRNDRQAVCVLLPKRK